VSAAEPDVPVLSLGAMVGGTRPQARAWRRAVSDLGSRVKAAREGVESPLRVNVVFQIPGEVLPVIEFSGVRTGRYASADRHLLIQAALPADVPAEPQRLLMELLGQAVELAVQFARRRGIADDLGELRELVSSLERSEG
jgi:hypothetical protein